MNGEWVQAELINGWKPIEHFPPVEYRAHSDGSLAFRGHAEPHDAAFPFMRLPAELHRYFDQRIGTEEWILSIDYEGYVYYDKTRVA